MKKLFLLLLAGALAGMLGGKVNAQQLPSYSQYMMNGFLLNPAMAGSEGYTSLNLTAREQWVGFPGAPRTHALSGESRILRKSYISKSTSVRRKIRHPSRSGRVGLGGYLFSDRNGITNRTGLQATYAYHIQLKKQQLSFGLSAIGYQFKISDSDIILHDDNDPLISGTDKVLYIPDFNFGSLFTTRNYFVGFSVNQLLQSSLKFGNRNYANYKMLRHYYLMGGYNFDVSDNVSIQPTMLIKTTTQNLRQIQVDFNARVYYRDDYWAGLSYRTGDAMVIMAGVKYNQYYFGYAFDYATSNIRKHSFGSHEFMIAAKFGDNARRYRWIQRY
jgi:type IX secretion system PorP/SprF family membrane protein